MLAAALGVLAAMPWGAASAAPRTASMVVDFETGAVLHDSNADAAVYPASLTKTMTLYLLFEAIREGRIKLDTALDVSKYASSMPPTRLGLKPGSRITAQEAMLALITKSANDAAVVIAEALGGTESAFAAKMTAKARALGMTRTTFRNASGLPDAGQRTTARDMVRLGVRMIADFPEYYRWFQTKQFVFRGRTHRNHNGLMARYSGMDGLKTGYIRASGFNLLSSALRRDRRLVAAVFGGKSARSRDNTMAGLLDRSFDKMFKADRALVASAERLFDQPVGPDDSDTLLASDEVIVSREPAQGDVDAAAAPAPSRGAIVKPSAKPVVTAALSSARTSASRGKAKAIYSVQVGAFKSKPQARGAALAAAKRAPGLLAGKPATVLPTKARSGTLYRAALTGLTLDQANAACRQLKKARQDCMVIRGS
ncbi:MAG TPA: D-alanyl-D-alanine carboxypeptidase family protein [Geminicoccaceae bacterium]|nr:D-alanyl-D-alanine carboxypeptidase family protein [Geminicoccus sp.]HMU50399.1 D-alanyl-D-alanine carboxypeptidase family protein [Geminicoccaceae bacterium]